MTDKEEIKFAIRYLKKGLKSKRTPPLYEELMNELGFVKKDKVMQGYTKGETDEMFRTKQVVTKDSAEVIKLRNQVLKAKELLTRFVMASVYFKGKETDLLTEAEQFLKECE